MKASEKIWIIFHWCTHLARWLIKALRGKKPRFLFIRPAIFGSTSILDTKNGKIINLNISDKVDYSVALQIFDTHDYDLAKTRRTDDLSGYYNEIITSGRSPLIIDCGGNTGIATKYFACSYPEADIVYVEPDLNNYQRALDNNSNNSKIDFIQAGIGSHATTAVLHDPGVGNWGYRLEESPDGGIRIIDIYSILQKYAPAKYTPFLLKIDIEGYEAELFSQNTDWIDRFPVIIIELHDWMLPGRSNSSNFLRAIASRDRDFILSGENVFSVSNPIAKGEIH